ncbi:hypothetical protein HMPREF9418_2633 [Neisseria macacae ATCC 33926]|uniref:Uncharacterized protein n=1 Tax=Neisseria macacae ATCC 33926 TaxID=997348 RepID=A0AA36XJ54_9NEIS|nr:hypothetical protein HMPREF9418_2633 [Neisseria macacae ATCC 33926]
MPLTEIARVAMNFHELLFWSWYRFICIEYIIIIWLGKKKNQDRGFH